MGDAIMHPPFYFEHAEPNIGLRCEVMRPSDNVLVESFGIGELKVTSE